MPSLCCMKAVLEKYEKDFREKGSARDKEIETGDLRRAEERIAELELTQRQMSGEDLEGLSLKHLQILEAKLETGLHRIRARKGLQTLNDIKDLQKKGQMILEENRRLREKLKERGETPVETNEAEESLLIDQLATQDPQSSDSMSTSFTLKLNGLLYENEVSETSLQLGLSTRPP
eukprot:TRINITY_DN19991_c1_g1_i1.p2 TRINITY_DN19991_c1_g1~~TRINITY_DN19991_c1_g1_i1.p2  ORF type:complete len:176 (-),score=47.99 TRINITY_DN19991_c1_g1_i1:239-766(-)